MQFHTSFLQCNLTQLPAKPTQNNLILIKWKNEKGEDKELRLKQSMCNEWKNIGFRLNIDNAVLQSWETKYHYDPQECINPVLSHWLDKPTDEYPVSWKGLCCLLEDVQLSQLANELEEALKNSQVCKLSIIISIIYSA